LFVAPIAIVAGLVVGGAHAAAAGTTLYVSTSGLDTNPCSKSAPCQTFQHAVVVASAGDTIKVAAGTYNQSVDLTKPLTFAGAGAGKSIIDGTNVDHGALGYYGVLGIDNSSGTAGRTAVHGFTIQHGFVTGNEYSVGLESPADIFVGDQTSGDTVQVDHVTLGPAQDEATFAGIGLDTLNAAPPVTVTDSTFTGSFQGALIEGGGAHGTLDTLKNNTFTALTACSITACAGTSFPPEGVFILSDQAGLAKATVSNNSFKSYAGDGIDASAGYSGGNCSQNACPGNVTITENANTFKLGGAAGADAIYLESDAGNQMTATITNNKGTVHAPTGTIQEVNKGGQLTVTEKNNTIKVV
jgi:hypothetical protein